MFIDFCDKCQQQRELIDINRACDVSGKRRSTIYNWIKAGRLHLYQSPSGHVLICKASLVQPYAKQPQATG